MPREACQWWPLSSDCSAHLRRCGRWRVGGDRKALFELLKRFQEGEALGRINAEGRPSFLWLREEFGSSQGLAAWRKWKLLRRFETEEPESLGSCLDPDALNALGRFLS